MCPQFVRLGLGLVLILCSSLPASASVCEERHRRELLIDGGFHGPLPAPVIDHGGRVWDEFAGVLVSADQPIFDRARASGHAGPWKDIGESVGLASVVMSGWSRDQESPRVAIFDRQHMKLVIWNGRDLSVEPAVRIPMARDWQGEVIPDALVGTPWEQENTTHRIVSGVMLPGLILMLMERREWTLGPDGAESAVLGLSVAGIQEGEARNWDWVMAVDVPNDAPPEARDHPRGYPSSMASYYPTSRQSDFQTAFVPFVDYVNHLPNTKAPGGQCGLIRLDRGGVGDAWEIGPVVEIVSSWGAIGEHYHAAGWTPSGVVLAIGDSIFNRVALLRCEDWDLYDDPKQWSVNPRWQGNAPDGSRVPVNQFWACCSGNDLDGLLVGGDNVSAAVYSVQVPPVGDDSPPTFRPLFGDQPATLLDGSIGVTTSWVHRDRPEAMGPIVARYCFDGGYPQFSRSLLSQDGENFTSVARLPQGYDRIAIPFLVDGRLHLHRQNSVGPSGFLRATPPSLDGSITRGLVVRPGGLDLLRDDSGRHRQPIALTAGPGIRLTTVDSADIPRTDDWQAAPDTVCYRVTGTPSTGAGKLVEFDLEDPRPADIDPDASSVGIHMKVMNVLSSKLLLETEMERGFGTSSKNFHIASSGDWNNCDAWTYISGNRADCRVSLFNRPSGEPTPIDFFLVIRSATLGAGAPNWMLDPVEDGSVPGDRVDFPLPIRSEEWSTTIELQIPPEAADFSVGSRMPVLPLCTWVFPGGHHITLRHRLASGEFQIESSFSSISTPVISPYHIVRGDTLKATLSSRGGVARLQVSSAGSMDEVPDEVVVPGVRRTYPTRLRIGGVDHALYSALIVKRLIVETPDSSGFGPGGPSAQPEFGQVARRPEPRRGRSAAGGRSGPDLFRILSLMGSSVEDLDMNVDLDGDGCITIVDLVEATRSRAGGWSRAHPSDSTTRTSPVTTPTSIDRWCPSACRE